jgi:hypothetical protein
MPVKIRERKKGGYTVLRTQAAKMNPAPALLTIPVYDYVAVWIPAPPTHKKRFRRPVRRKENVTKSTGRFRPSRAIMR